MAEPAAPQRGRERTAAILAVGAALVLALGAAAVICAPTRADIAITFETEPGLLTIAMDYGWLRACGVTATSDPDAAARAHAAADQIAAGRVRAWYLEAGLGGSGDAVDTALTSAKAMVSGALVDWHELDLALPEGADSWATEPELHTVR